MDRLTTGRCTAVAAKVFICLLAVPAWTASGASAIAAPSHGDSMAPDSAVSPRRAPPSPDIWAAARTGDVAAIERHLAAGADTNQPDSALGVTPLAWAAIHGHAEAIGRLIDRGADVDGRNRDGATPLHSAAFFGRTEAVKRLLECGADANAQNRYGQTPLDTLAADWELTQYIAGILRLEVDRPRVEAGRRETAEVLRQHGGKEGGGLALVVRIWLMVFVVTLAIGVIASTVACLVFMSVLKALPAEHRKIEVWQIWLLVIPCFSWVWNFFVFPRMSQSCTSYLQSLSGRDDDDAAAGLGWWYCICTAATVVSRLAVLPSLVLLAIYLVRIHRYKNQILAGDLLLTAEAIDDSLPDTAEPVESISPAARRHDLDALRSVAMLAGIVLHGALSFVPVPWPVQDSRQLDWLALFIAATHGFRMPLFFLLSGFFTAMLWRRRGLPAVLRHRFQRIFLPCMLGLITVVPAVNIISVVAMVTAPDPSVGEAFSDGASVRLYGKGARPVDATAGGEGARLGPLRGVGMLLIYAPVFHHLWFLWFLCWLVVAFAVYAAIADQRRWRGPPTWLILSPVRYLWLLPLTMIPQLFMGALYTTFGPDTSSGLLPAPHILAYYAIFFGFGALYYDADDQDGRVGRCWWLTLPIALLVLFPLGIDFIYGHFGFRERFDPTWYRRIADILQVTYTWLMTFGCMGAFRRVLSGESRAMRYVSDSSYWLYVMHLPLIIAAQMAVRSWPLPAMAKLLLVCGAVVSVLLFAYQMMVRYTRLGTLLNGPRLRYNDSRS